VLDDGARRGEFAAIDPAEGARMLKQATLCWTHPVLIAECDGQANTRTRRRWPASWTGCWTC
jgi:hypothetical protein